MSKIELINNMLLEDKLSFIEIELINQPSGKPGFCKVYNSSINKKKYFNYQNNIKRLTKSKGKKIFSKVKFFNNYKEVNIGNKFYYYDTLCLHNSFYKINNIHFLMKQMDNKILDPVEFPDFKKYHSKYTEQTYKYRFMQDNRVINSIDIYFSSIKEKDNSYFTVYFKFKVCKKNHKIINNNLLTILNKIGFIPKYKRND